MSTRVIQPYTPKGPRVLTGPESVKAADALRRQQENIELWPYPWLFPEKGAKRVFSSGSAVLNTGDPQAQVTSYQVPVGKQFAWTELVQIIMPVTALENLILGDAVWVDDIDTPIGVTVAQGYPLQGFGSLPFPLGTLQVPWYLTQPEILNSGQIARMKVTNVSAGPGVVFLSIIGGWIWSSSS